jgi:hypothetical protein
MPRRAVLPDGKAGAGGIVLEPPSRVDGVARDRKSGGGGLDLGVNSEPAAGCMLLPPPAGVESPADSPRVTDSKIRVGLVRRVDKARESLPCDRLNSFNSAARFLGSLSAK